MAHMLPRGAAIALLLLALGGVAAFGGGLRLVDTIGLLACGVVAGVALAEIAAARRKGPRRSSPYR
jgi:hypothetical protein